MLVLAELHKVRRHEGKKLKAEVSLLVSDPDQLIRIPLFESHQKAGLIEAFEKLKGKTFQVPLEVDLYQGRLQYSISFGGLPSLVNIKT